jgi:hypothetical protein
MMNLPFVSSLPRKPDGARRNGLSQCLARRLAKGDVVEESTAQKKRTPIPS